MLIKMHDRSDEFVPIKNFTNCSTKADWRSQSAFAFLLLQLLLLVVNNCLRLPFDCLEDILVNRSGSSCVERRSGRDQGIRIGLRIGCAGVDRDT